MQRERIEFRTLSGVDLLLDSIRIPTLKDLNHPNVDQHYSIAVELVSLIQSKGEIDVYN